MKSGFICLGLAASMSAHAADWQVVYTGEQAKNTRGGLESDAAYLGNLDVTAEWNDIGESGGKAFVYVLGNHGESPTEFIGDAQVFSNIDAPKSLKLYEAWYEQPFGNGLASWKAGLIDLNSEFDVVNAAGLFQNSSFGIGADFSQSGENGPSIFPTTSPGVRLAITAASGAYGQCILLDAVPGDIENDRGTHVRISSSEGGLLACEAGWNLGADEGAAKVAAGGWHYEQETPHLDGIGEEQNRGVYVLAEKGIWQSGQRSVAAFLRVGGAVEDVNPYAKYTGGGLVLTGVFSPSSGDQVGFGVASVRASDSFVDTADTGVENAETVFELVYRISPLEWLALQPGLQYIKNPGFDPGLDNALAVSLRFELSQAGSF